MGRDRDSIGNAVVTMFTYLSKDRAKTKLVAGCTLARVLRRPREELGRLLPFGTPEQCIQKIRRLAKAGAKRVHYGPSKTNWCRWRSSAIK